jgi:hypothetical protein
MDGCGFRKLREEKEEAVSSRDYRLQQIAEG